MSLFPEQAPPAEPKWLADARRRDSKLQAPLVPTADDRRALLKAYDEQVARLSQVEAARDELKQELAQQEAEKLALIRQLPPEGDGGLWALQSLEWYFREGGHRAALANIRAAAHNMGWCLDDMGADEIVPTVGICPLCEYDSMPRPAPGPAPLVAEAAPAGWFPPTVFSSAAEYDASVQSVVERIESGGVKPIEQEGGGND
jgi:hypothetical protein